MIIPIKNTYNINDIFEFLDTFKLDEEFKKDFNCSIEEWDFKLSDGEVIEFYLDKFKDYYTIDFIDNRKDGYFLINRIDINNLKGGA